MVLRSILPALRGRLWRLDHGIALLGAALALLGCGVGLLVIWNAHDSTVRQELDRSDAVGRLLEDHVVQTVKGADAVLKGLAPQVQQAPSGLDAASLRQRLGQSIRALPFLKSVSLLDAQGHVLLSTEPANEGVILEPAQFRTALADESGRSWMGAVRAGRDLYEGGARRPQAVTAGQRHLTLTVPLEGGGWSRAAYLLATVHGEHFARFQDGVLPAWGREAALLQHGGRTLSASWGSEWVDARWGEHGEEEEATGSRVRRGLAGSLSFVAQRRLAEWPLDVWVEQDYERGMAPWRDTVRMVFFAELAYIILLVGVGMVAKRLLEGHRKTTQALAQSQAEMTGLASRADLEAQLRARAQMEAQRAGELLAHMSHELRTPLTGVMGVLDLLEKEALSHKGRQLLHVAHESSSMLLRHINHLLDLTKAEGGHVEIVRKDVDLHACLEADVESLRGTLRSPQVGLRLEWMADTPNDWHVDEYRVRQVMLNLLGNAVKFTDQGEIVLQVCRWSGDGRVPPGLSLTVRDTGLGIPLEDQERIFDRFAQARAQRRDRPLGTGLGLAICRTMTELQGGRIELTSAVGEGSRFTVRLPAMQAARPVCPPPVRPDPAVREAGAPARRLKVLVVDDVPANCLVLAEYLEQEGHESRCVGDGAEALEAMRGEAFDVIFLDDRMPGLSGHELVRHIRQLGRHSRTPSTVQVVGVSANVMPHEKERFLAAGADQFLSKPVEPPMLHEALLKLATAAQGFGSWPQPPVRDEAAPPGQAAGAVFPASARTEGRGPAHKAQDHLPAPASASSIGPDLRRSPGLAAAADTVQGVAPSPSQARVQARVRQLLLEGLPQMAARLQAATDAPALRELAHQLKGSLAYAGWPQWCAQAREAELAAIGSDRDRSAALLASLLAELQTVEGASTIAVASVDPA